MSKVLVANRGEIAIRVLRSASELGWKTVAIYCEKDPSHATFADEAVKLNNVGEFMDANIVARIAAETKCTHVHPGYGFLSESPFLPAALFKADPTITFIGPTAETLAIASDKLSSRNLATSLGVYVAPGVQVTSAEDVYQFARNTGFPIMIKALDGGGGRGIRIVESEESIEESYKRCLGESPSRQVFAEKALTGPGWKHIEVQIIGDGTGQVNHFWERECSVQRRFQKVIEVAPSQLSRQAVNPLINASLTIARKLSYHGLGTFEYLLNTTTSDWIFLEINPRLQVEHTITEEVNNVDLVRTQLLLFTPSATLETLDLVNPRPFPRAHAIQLRLTAEDPTKGFQLSPGTIDSANLIWPAGNGIRVDTWLTSTPRIPLRSWTVGTDLDSLLAKIIVRGSSYDEITAKGIRSVRELSLGETVKTNATVLLGALLHPDWKSNAIDTLWLERNLDQILDLGKRLLDAQGPALEISSPTATTAISNPTGGGIRLQPGSLFNLSFSPNDGTSSSGPPVKHTVTLSSIGQNAFPETLTGTLQTSILPTPIRFSLSQSTSAAVASDAFEFANPNDRNHVGTPLTGKVVELHSALMAVAAEGVPQPVQKGETLVVLSVMKMENVVSAPFDGFVQRVGKGVRVGVVVGEGMLLCVVERRGEMASRL